MNVATRLSEMLTKIQTSKNPKAFETFEEIFNVEGCTAVATKLLICNKQIDKLEQNNADKRLITFLRILFNCKTLARNIDNERKNIVPSIMTLNTVAPYMPEENVDTSAITELSDALEILRAKIDNIDGIEEHDKEVLYSFVDEMRNAIDDINIGGIEVFMEHAEIASGKILMHHESFVKSKTMEDATNIFHKATQIINDSQTWIGVIGWVGDKLLK